MRFHSEQAGCYQCSVLVINAVLFIVFLSSGIFSVIQAFQGKAELGASWISLVAVVLGLVWFVGTIVYGIIGAVMVLLGKPFKYAIIGDRFRPNDDLGLQIQNPIRK